MKFRTKLYALSGVAAFLAIAIALGLVFSPENTQKRSLRGDILADKSKDKVAGAKIEANGQSVILKKSPDGWLLEKAGIDFPASASKVESLLAALSSAQEMFKVSSKKDSFASLGLTPAGKRITLSDSSGKAIVDIVLGKEEGNGKKIYLAFQGKDAAYSVKNTLAGFLQTDDRSWADLKAVSKVFKDGEIQEISVKGSLPDSDGAEAVTADYRLLRDAKKGWIVNGNPGFALDPNKVDRYVDSVTSMEGDAFVTDKAAEAKKLLETPLVTISFRSGKGTEYRILMAGPDAEKRYVAKEASSANMIYANAFTAYNQVKTLDSLKFVEPEKKAPKKK
jgi:hypothetical protein